MKRIALFLRITTLLFVIAFVISCKRTDTVDPGTNNDTGTPPVNNYTPPAVTFSATVQGFVVDEAGNAVGDAEVKTGNKTAKTDANGYFRIENAPFTGNFCYIKAEKKGFFIGSTTIHGKAGNGYFAELVMVAQNNVVSFPASQSKSISLQSGASVILPANGFVTPDGKTYTGNVNVAIVHIDPAAKNFSDLIPGGDLRAFDAKGQNMQLYSYGMLNVEIRDDVGNLLQLAKSSTATITLPVPASMTANAPASIPLWYFDEDKGIWIEDGSATLSGMNYTGSVSHFTAWNVDKPYSPAIIEGRVVDSDGNPVGLATVKIGQAKVYSDKDGFFIFYASSNEDMIIDVIEWETGEKMGINKAVHTPGVGQTINVGDIVIPKTTKVLVKATVVDCDSKPFTGYATISKGGFIGRTLVTNSKFEYRLSATGGQAELIIYSNSQNLHNKSTITIPSNNSVPIKDMGTIKVCNANANTYYIKFTYTLPGQQPVDVVKISPVVAEGSGVSNSDRTGMFISDATTDPARTYGFSIGVLGNKPGTKYFLTHNQSGLQGGVFSYTDFVTPFQVYSDSLILEFTSYENPGGVITGIFSGRARIDNKINDDYQTQPIGTITNGEFRVLRINDK